VRANIWHVIDGLFSIAQS